MSIYSMTSVAKILMLGLLFGCAQPPARRAPAEVHGLMPWLSDFRSWVKTDFSAVNCETRLHGYYRDLLETIPAEQLATELRGRGLEAARAFFEARQDLREGMLRQYRDGTLSESCVNQARDVMRVLRYAEEYIAEHALSPATYDAKKPYPYLGGEAPYFQVSSGSFSAPADLRSGDIILSRGDAFASAAIARMSKVPGQFSHGAFIYVDPATKKPWVLEAHIEIGSSVRTYEEYAKNTNVRAMVLRMRTTEDRELAARAAAIAYERLRAAAASPAKGVPYDFAMDLSDDREFFCTEIPYYGFMKASLGKVYVPLFLGRVEPKNRNFVDRLGIKVSRSFLPSDLDVDPRFEIIAEWRDLSRMGSVRRKDAVLDRFYSWADDHGYVLHGNFSSWFKKTLIWRMRRWPLFSELLDGKFPLNMPQSVLETISVLNDLGEVLESEVEKFDDRTLRSRGMRLTITEMERFLDEFRLRDFERDREYRRWRKYHAGTSRGPPPPAMPKIHLIFNARR
jgi:hypothetical protein